MWELQWKISNKRHSCYCHLYNFCGAQWRLFIVIFNFIKYLKSHSCWSLGLLSVIMNIHSEDFARRPKHQSFKSNITMIEPYTKSHKDTLTPITALHTLLQPCSKAYCRLYKKPVYFFQALNSYNIFTILTREIYTMIKWVRRKCVILKNIMKPIVCNIHHSKLQIQMTIWPIIIS